MMDEIIKQLKPLINGKLIYLCQYGSHLYGLNTENSDLDFRGVYVPTLDDIILKKDKDEINTELVFEETKFISARNITDSYGFVHCLKESKETKEIKVDVKIFSLQKFIKLCSKADTNALDLLFSYNSKFEKYLPEIYIENETKYKLIEYIYEYANLLIDTSRLESPITYAYKQAEKYSLKGTRLNSLRYVLEEAKKLSLRPVAKPLDYHTVGELTTDFLKLDGNNLRIDELDNKGKIEKYLFVCGVQHQFNLDLDVFIERIEEKINKEYTSQRTKDAIDGNDWKALSHALRILSQIKELYETGDIKFPLKNKEFILKVKLGQVSREEVNKIFDSDMSNILDMVKEDKLQWRYNEEFWNKFLLEVIK